MKYTIIVILLCFCNMSYAVDIDYMGEAPLVIVTEEDRVCPEHGYIEDYVTISYAGITYYWCSECVRELFENNNEEASKLIEAFWRSNEQTK